MQNNQPDTHDELSPQMQEFFQHLKSQAKAPPTFLSSVLEQARREPLFPQQTQGSDDNQVREGVRDQLTRWLSDLWVPPLSGQLATAADIPPQQRTFYLEEGDISVNYKWWPATRYRPAGLWLQWRADVTRPGCIWVRFDRIVDGEAPVVLREIPLGNALAGEIELSAATLGFDPSRELLALRIRIDNSMS